MKRSGDLRGTRRLTKEARALLSDGPPETCYVKTIPYLGRSLLLIAMESHEDLVAELHFGAARENVYVHQLLLDLRGNALCLV